MKVELDSYLQTLWPTFTFAYWELAWLGAKSRTTLLLSRTYPILLGYLQALCPRVWSRAGEPTWLTCFGSRLGHVRAASKD